MLFTLIIKKYFIPSTLLVLIVITGIFYIQPNHNPQPPRQESICSGKLIDDFNECMNDLALTTKDVSWCNNISDGYCPNSPIGCLPSKRSCREALAQKTGNGDYCIDPVTGRDFAHSKYLRDCRTEAALATKDLNACADSLECLDTSLAIWYRESSSSPEIISNCTHLKNATGTDICFLQTANLLSDKQICRKIIGKDLLNECRKDFAYKDNDLDECQDITNTDMRNDCIYYVVTSSANKKNCDLIKPDPREPVKYVLDNIVDTSISDLKNNCYREIAKRDLEPMECAKISDNFTKNYCYIDLAQTSQDPKYCNYIDDKYSSTLAPSDRAMCRNLNKLK